MYSDRPEFNDYQKSIIAFVDILGFNSRVKAIKSKSDFDKLANLIYAIKKNAEAFNDSKDLFNDFKLLAVSDSLIITVPYTCPISTIGLIHIISKLQYDLIALEYRTLVRGYINIGDVYHKDGLLFGKGYSEAYDQESKIGYAPRVVLSPNIITDAKSKIAKVEDLTSVKTIFDYIKRDPDDHQYFIDYFRFVSEDVGDNFSPQQQVAEMKAIKIFLKKRIEYFDKREEIQKKYEWVLNYHNESFEAYPSV